MIVTDDGDRISKLVDDARPPASNVTTQPGSPVHKVSPNRAVPWLFTLLIEALLHCACTQHAVHPDMLDCLANPHPSRDP